MELCTFALGRLFHKVLNVLHARVAACSTGRVVSSAECAINFSVLQSSGLQLGREVGNGESKGHAQPQCKGHLGPVCGERLGSETLYPQASSKEPDEAGREDQMHPEAEENANKARIEAERRTVAGAKEAKRLAAQEVLLEADKAKKEAEAAAQAMEEAKVKGAEELRAKAEAEKAARQANRPDCRPERMLPAPARHGFQQGMPRVGGVFPASIRQLVGWF